MNRKPAFDLQRLAAYAIVGIGGVLMLAPFYFMFVFATHTRSDIFSLPPPVWFGDALSLNMGLLLDAVPLFWRNFGLSVYIGLMATALSLFFCSLAGFAFAMYDFRFKKAAFAIVMATLLLPPFLGMIPTFMIMDFLGWLNQPRALYLPSAAGAFGIFLMRQYIASAIPKELIEAARMDGCGEFRIYWNIVLPLTTPALGTLGLITFIASWNNFLGPLVVMREMESYTLPLALRSMQNPVNTEWGAVMVGSAVAVLPLLVLFVLSSRRLIDGLTAGAVKS
ncbi:carbohydrate ABC transporter permease [Piscinibacter sp.]|uniref:carbohydrate ABC transporter permease n=1 Tax=Piscinibacter sp. TaxID=1903157 RepID=UPI002BC0227E|nr:carbohydrate ABC transporter permease [Albitalea sp.]HUG23439.1 carbohydrate ABC transporter permease [Albitalea sp.]